MESVSVQKRGRNMLVPLMSVIVFLLGFEGGGFQLALTDIAAEFRLDNTAMGALVTVEYAAIIVMPLIFGGLSDKIGKKKMLAIFIPILIAGCAFVIGSRSVAAFGVGIFTVGAGYSVAECLGAAALSDSDPQRAEKNISLTQSLYSAGAVISPILINALMSGGLDWRIVFVLTGLGFAALLPALFATKFRNLAAAAQQEEKHGAPQLLLNVVFIILALGMFLYVGMENGLAYFADSFFMTQIGLPQLSAYALSLFWLTMAGSRLLFGVIKTDPQKAVAWIFGGSAVLLLGIAFAQNAVFALVLCALAGAVFGPVWPMLIGMATRRFKERSGMAASIVMAAAGAGGGLSPLLLGAFADSLGLRASFGALAAFAAVGFLLFALALRRNREPRAAKGELP